MGSGPLAGVTVYDFSQVVAGPYGGVLLADYGADVINVEPPGGKAERELLLRTAFPNVSHNKRSIAIDLKKDDTDELIARIAEDADIVVHNFTPGTMERLGCGYETMREHNEQLVYGSVTGFGEDGPYNDRRGYDPIAQAISGLMSITGDPDRKPARVGTSLIDYGVGAHMAFAALAALWNRERTGEGCRFEVSLLDVAAACMGYWYTYYTMYGKNPTRHGSSLEVNASQGSFYTEDGIVFVEFGNERHFSRMVDALGKAAWTENPRLNSVEARNENREYLHETVQETFENYSTDDLLELLLGADVPAASVNKVSEAVEDPQLRHRGTITSIESNGQEVLIGGRPIHFDGFEANLEPPPELAEHTEGILGDLGFSEAEIRRYIETGVTPIPE